MIQLEQYGTKYIANILCNKKFSPISDFHFQNGNGKSMGINISRDETSGKSTFHTINDLEVYITESSINVANARNDSLD